MKYEIQKMLCVSTAHISKATNDWLIHEGLQIMQSEYGFIIWKAMPHDGSPELIALQKLACELRVDFIHLDRDGPVLEGFKTYDW
jgi:hypothetical protein